jgi:hypothetical protein
VESSRDNERQAIAVIKSDRLNILAFIHLVANKKDDLAIASNSQKIITNPRIKLIGFSVLLRI